MVEDAQRKTPEQDSDYDGAWKEALRHHLAEFLAKYFPAMHAAIDWSYPPRWFDKVHGATWFFAPRVAVGIIGERYS